MIVQGHLPTAAFKTLTAWPLKCPHSFFIAPLPSLICIYVLFYIVHACVEQKQSSALTLYSWRSRQSWMRLTRVSSFSLWTSLSWGRQSRMGSNVVLSIISSAQCKSIGSLQSILTFESRVSNLPGSADHARNTAGTRQAMRPLRTRWPRRSRRPRRTHNT